MKQLLHEPLMHFLLIGGLLFGLFSLRGNQTPGEASNRIHITAGEIEQMLATFVGQRLRPPSEEEMKGLISARVQEEVLYREALGMGLDRDDTIVRRRLAQKLEFLMEDLSELGSPTDAELIAFLNEHGDRYQVPGRLSFEHIYFSVGQRGKRAEQDAKNDLARLRAGAPAAAVNQMGDAFLLEYVYKQSAQEEIEKVFGSGFAGELAKLPLREWQGPIGSGYGMHLVRVEERETSHASGLESVREQVKQDWLAARRSQLKEAAIKKLRERYEVVIDDKSLRAAVIARSEVGSGSER